MVVLATFSAVPVVVVKGVGGAGDGDGAAAGCGEGGTVPVLRVQPPVKLIVPPVLVVSDRRQSRR